MFIYTYLIYSKNYNKYYTGITKNPNKRLDEHNKGKLKTSSKYNPYKLVYTKKYESYQDARKNECWLKKKNHQYKNKLAQLTPPETGEVK